MEKKQLIEILDTFEKIILRTTKTQKLTQEYWEIVSDKEFSPITVYNELSGFLLGIKLMNEELWTELEDWMYEWYVIPSVWEKKWKKYKMRWFEDFKAYILDQF